MVVGDYVLIAQAGIIADSFSALPPQSASRQELMLGDRRGWRNDESQPEVKRPQGGAEPTQTDIVIGDDAWIGSRAILLGGAHLGRGVIIGAAAVVDFTIPGYAIVAANPARIVGWARPKVSLEM